MFHSIDYRELRNGKRYQTSIERTMSNHGSTEELANRTSSENVEGEVPGFQTLTQKAFNEQIRGFIAPLTRQVEGLARLVQGMTTPRHPGLSLVPLLVPPCLSPTSVDCFWEVSVEFSKNCCCISFNLLAICLLRSLSCILILCLTCFSSTMILKSRILSVSGGSFTSELTGLPLVDISTFYLQLYLLPLQRV